MNFSRQIKLLFAAAFAQAFIMWYAVEKLFMQQIGFTSATIASSLAVMTVVVLFAETPAGVLADRWSRKGVLILSNVALALATLLASFSTTIWMYTAALALMGVYFALYSGIYDSIIYDATMEQDGNSKRYKKRFGMFQVLSGVALVSSSIVGSIAAQSFGLQWAYWLTIPFSIASCVLLLFFKEPRLHVAVDEQTLVSHLKNSARTLARPNVRLIVLSMAIVGVVMGLQFSFGQLWYIAVALPIVLYGPAYAALQACLSFGGIAADRVRLGILPLIVLFGLSTIMLTIPNPAIIVAGQIILQTTLVIIMIGLSGSIHDQISSNQRSGVNSAISTLTKLASLPIGLLVGMVSQEFSIFSTPIIIAALLFGLTFLLSKARVHSTASKVTGL